MIKNEAYNILHIIYFSVGGVMYMTVNTVRKKAMTVKNLLVGSKHEQNRHTYILGTLEAVA